MGSRRTLVRRTDFGGFDDRGLDGLGLGHLEGSSFVCCGIARVVLKYRVPALFHLWLSCSRKMICAVDLRR